jgi:hypothetical protein
LVDAYLLELVSFPNSKNDDQVDSTVFALAWSTSKLEPGIIGFYRNEAAKIQGNAAGQSELIRVLVPANGSSHWYLITGRKVAIPPDRIIEVTEEELGAVLQAGGKRVN